MSFKHIKRRVVGISIPDGPNPLHCCYYDKSLARRHKSFWLPTHDPVKENVNASLCVIMYLVGAGNRVLNKTILRIIIAFAKIVSQIVD